MKKTGLSGERGSDVQTLRLLFVCTGNTCRSPMAAALTGHLGRQLDLPFQLEVRSRGLYAVEGDPMSALAREALAERGVAAEDHRAAMLEEADLEWADLVLTMTMQHKRFLWEAFPAYQEKTYTLKEYIQDQESSDQGPAGPDQPKNPDDFSWEYLENYFSSLDVQDPFGGDLNDYRRTRDELEAHLERLLKRLAATVSPKKDQI